MATFETFALQCAAGVALDLLAAISNIESGVQPLAVRMGHKLTVVKSAGEGVAVAVGLTDQGREPGIGLMGLTPRQLQAAGYSLQDGFDACKSLNAAAAIIRAAQVNAVERGHGPATGGRQAVRSWWRPDSRFTAATLLEAAVANERSRSAALVKLPLIGSPPEASVPKPITPTAMAPTQRPLAGPAAVPDCWDVFARHRAGFTQCETADIARPITTGARRPSPQTTAAQTPSFER